MLDNNKERISLQFPAIFAPGNITGKIIMFRPSDSSLDFSLLLELKRDGSQKINSIKLKIGVLVIKIFWNMQQNEYYSEKRIFFNN